MFDAPVSDAPHSAAVTLSLVTPGGTYPLSQIGPNRITLQKLEHIRSGEAQVVMVIDGREFRWSVTLPHDIMPFELSNDIKVRLRRATIVSPAP